MSALEKNILYMLLAQLKDDDPIDKRYYQIDFKELEQRLGKKLAIPALVKAAEGLVCRVYTIHKEEGGILCTSLISSVKNMPEQNSIRLGVSSMVRPYLFSLKKNATEYELDKALKLKSKYAKRLYEMLSQHKEQGKMCITVDALKYRLALKEPKTGQEKYTTWSMFSKQVLQGPQRELAQHTDISFSYTAKKSGRKFTELEFYIRRNPNLPEEAYSNMSLLIERQGRAAGVQTSHLENSPAHALRRGRHSVQ